MAALTDHYSTLGASISDTAAEIENKYKKLAQKYHPDSTTGDAEKFKQITEAHRILSDTEKRREYNKHRLLKSQYIPEYDISDKQTQDIKISHEDTLSQNIQAAAERFNRALTSNFS